MCYTWPQSDSQFSEAGSGRKYEVKTVYTIQYSRWTVLDRSNTVIVLRSTRQRLYVSELNAKIFRFSIVFLTHGLGIFSHCCFVLWGINQLVPGSRLEKLRMVKAFYSLITSPSYFVSNSLYCRLMNEMEYAMGSTHKPSITNTHRSKRPLMVIKWTGRGF